MNETSTYVPGSCNIGHGERQKRGKQAVLFFAVLLVVMGGLWFCGFPRIWRLAVFIPATATVLGIQQWRTRFCVGFGLAGVYNLDEPGSAARIEMADSLKADRRKSWKMVGIAALGGGAITAAFWFV